MRTLPLHSHRNHELQNCHSHSFIFLRIRMIRKKPVNSQKAIRKKSESKQKREKEVKSMTKTYLPGDTRDRIRDLIKSNDITQAELAEKVGLSASAFSRYLMRKTKNLGDGCIIRIAKYFNVSTDFLLGETDSPDRKNYDIEELGLSVDAARLLYTREIDPETLNLLLTNPRFPELVSQIREYRYGLIKNGIKAYNQVLSLAGKMMMEHGRKHPEKKEAMKEAREDIDREKAPVVQLEVDRIRVMFMAIIQDIGKQCESIVKKYETATKKTLESLMENLKDLAPDHDPEKATLENISDSVILTVEQQGAEISEGTALNMKNTIMQFYEETKDMKNDQRGTLEIGRAHV